MMQGFTPERRTNFQRKATTRDSKRGQIGNTVIRDPRILCTPFKITGFAPAYRPQMLFVVCFSNYILLQFSASIVDTSLGKRELVVVLDVCLCPHFVVSCFSSSSI